MPNFLLNALLAGLGVAMVAGPLGAFVVWRRMAFFGDTLAHGALLGVALGALLRVDATLAVAAVSLILALLFLPLERQRGLSADSALGVLAQTSLSLGLIAMSLIEGARPDLLGALFGDVLAVTPDDLAWIWGGGALVLGLLLAWWRPLLALTVSEDIARVEGVPVARLRLALTLMIALVLAVALKVIGLLLFSALLVIPAAAARRLSATPEQMALLASAIGALAVMGGLGASALVDIPAGPGIVTAAAVIFAAVQLARLVPGVTRA